MERVLSFAKEQGLLPEGGLVLCALSGGADSVALTHFLWANGFSVAAAHFDHHLRPTSAEDAKFSADFCAGLGIPFYLGGAQVGAMSGNVEANARQARYDFLARTARQIGAEVIVTAHNANDNLETVLLHLTRGCGLQGLCGIRPRLGNVVRPMLQTPRSAIEAYVAANGLPHVTDETNADDRYARNRIRHQVVPVLEGLNAKVVEGAARMTDYLRADLERLGPREAPPAAEALPRLEPQAIAVGDRVETPLWTVELTQGPCPAAPPTPEAFWLKPTGPLRLRSRQGGDFLHPPFRTGKTVKKWLIELGVPREEREAVPVLVAGERVLAAAGIGPEQAALARPGEEAILVRFIKREREEQ